MTRQLQPLEKAGESSSGQIRRACARLPDTFVRFLYLPVRLTSDFERNIMSKRKDLGVFLLIVLLYIAVMSITGIGCPIRWFTGISCPGCGMSRAFFSLLHLDFAGAFRYHPLIYPIILFVPYYFLGSEKTDRQKKVKKTLLILLAILAICLWIFRIFHEDSVVRIDLSNSVMIKYLKQMKGVLKCT